MAFSYGKFIWKYKYKISFPRTPEDLYGSETYQIVIVDVPLLTNKLRYLIDTMCSCLSCVLYWFIHLRALQVQNAVFCFCSYTDGPLSSLYVR